MRNADERTSTRDSIRLCCRVHHPMNAELKRGIDQRTGCRATRLRDERRTTRMRRQVAALSKGWRGRNTANVFLAAGRLFWVGTTCALLSITGCASHSEATTSTNPPPTQTLALNDPSGTPNQQRTQEICASVDAAGTFYAVVTSPDHNFTMCAMFKKFDGSLADLMQMPGMKRRCALSAQVDINVDAKEVAIYSDGQTGDLSEATEFCSLNQGDPTISVP